MDEGPVTRGDRAFDIVRDDEGQPSWDCSPSTSSGVPVLISTL
jgi:hypothetical protein